MIFDPDPTSMPPVEGGTEEGGTQGSDAPAAPGGVPGSDAPAGSPTGGEGQGPAGGTGQG